jgi:cell division protein FtsW
VLALLVIGLIAVYSASFVIGLAEHGDRHYYIVRQAAWAVVGLGLMWFFARMGYERLKVLCVPFMLVALLALSATELPGIGHSQNGAVRWIRLGPLPPVQPSEFAKLAVVLYVATWLSSKGTPVVRDWRQGFLPFVTMIALIGILLMNQPDLGTAVVITMAMIAMFWVAGASLVQMLALALAAGIVVFSVVGLLGYNEQRIEAFTSAEEDPGGTGYQTLQLELAFGSGGLTGLGLGASRQKFFYVPGAHTDGIFAIIGEEAGFVGASAVLALFAMLVYRGLKLAHLARDDFGRLLVVGVISWIAIQAFLNIGGITRTIPMTGIPLPFISVGGSSLAALLAGMGVVLSVSRHAHQAGEARIGRRGGMRSVGQRT